MIDDAITLGVYGGVVQWVLTFGDAKEPCALFKSFGSHAGYFHQLFARREGAVGGTVGDDVLCQLRTQPGDVGEQMTTGGIEVDAYLVDTVLNRLVERFLQLRLVYIMLVLTYTNGFGVDFTSSANGSIRRRAMDTAPRTVTS